MRLLTVTAALLFSLPANADFVANTYGSEVKYRIFEFMDDGDARRPVSGAGIESAAWPSAVDTGSIRYVYASVRESGVWKHIARWKSVSGGAYTYDGIVLSADAGETDGIGPATVSYSAGTYYIYYKSRGNRQIKLATSTDGLTFTKQGVVYAGGAESPDGLTVSYQCREGGVSRLFLHGYYSGGDRANSFTATASSDSGPYVYEGLIVSPTAVVGSAVGTQGNSFFTYSGSTLTPGMTIVIYNSGWEADPYIVRSVDGSVVYVDRPTERSYSGHAVADILRNKADVSFVRKRAPGDWFAAITGYGQFSGVVSEYTTQGVASSITGPYTLGGGYVVRPYFNSGEFSTENPEPVRTGNDCAQ